MIIVGESQRSAKGVAGGHVTGLIAGGEPVLALLGEAMGPGLGRDASLRLLLDTIIADGGCGVEAAVEIRAGQYRTIAGLGRVVRPDACQPVGL